MRLRWFTNTGSKRDEGFGSVRPIRPTSRTIADFVALARELGATIDRSVALDRRGAPVLPLLTRTWNLLGEYFPYGAIGDALALVRMSRSSSGAAREK